MIGRFTLPVTHRVDAMAMTETDFEQKLDELDRLLNDPEVALQPHRVWSLLAELSVPGPHQMAAPAAPRHA